MRDTNQHDKDVIEAALSGEQMFMEPNSGNIYCASIDGQEVIDESKLYEVFLIGSEWVEEKDIDAAIDRVIDAKFGDSEFVDAKLDLDPYAPDKSYTLCKWDVRKHIVNAIVEWGIPVVQCVHKVLSALTTGEQENE